MTPPLPPPLAERLLRATIADPAWSDAIVGDLREEFVALARARGLVAARRWYWNQALRLSARKAAGRLAPGRARAWEPPSDPRLRDGSVGWLQESRHAWRALAHRPLLSGAIVVTLGVALAANATIFNLADAIHLRPFRFPGVERAVIVNSSPENDPLSDRSNVAPADFRDWARDSTTLDTFAAAEFWDPNLSAVDQPEQLAGFRVSPAFFRTLATGPLIGRTFADDEATPGRDRRVVISHALWSRRFAADPALLGQSLRLDGESYEVIGVMPEGFKVPYGAQVWAPLALDEAGWQDRRRGSLLVTARLAEGATLESAAAEMRALVARQRQAFPDTNAAREVSVVTFTRGMSDAGAGRFLALWQAAAFLLLLIASANVANLLLARGSERQHEFALRLALGARRRRLAAQVMLEGGWLALISVALSLPLAYLGVTATRQALPPSILRWVAGWEFIGVDYTMLGFSAGLALVAMMLFSLLPALSASRAVVATTLRQGGRSLVGGGERHWLRTALASAQVALAVALITAALLILGAVDTAVNGAVGFDKRQVMTAQFRLPEAPYADAQKRRQFVQTALERLEAIPAIESAATVSELPYAGGGAARRFYPEGVTLTQAEVKFVDYRRATPNYLDLMRIPLLEGRALTDDDRADTRAVALVSKSLADRYWPGERAIGRRFRTADDGPWVEVVGVTGDVMQDWFMRQRNPTVYRPIAQDVSFNMSLVARTVGNPLDVAGELRRAVAAADPDQPILQLATMDQVMDAKVAGVAYLAKALAVMSGIALLLALTGVYSLMAYLASRRTQEIGVRIALGASRWQVVRMASSQAVVITAIGTTIGAALAFGVGRLMEAVLFGLVTTNLAAQLGLVLVLALVALAAGVLPARRAANLDPSVALRND